MLGFDKSFKALADPTRRAILSALRGGPRNAGELAQHVGLPPNAVSFHLNVLKAGDLIFDRRQGQFIVYYLNTTVLDDFMQFLLEQFSNGRPLPRRRKSRPADGTGTANSVPRKSNRKEKTP